MTFYYQCFSCLFFFFKVVYFTVLGPFILLAVFLVRGALLPGAREGIIFYVTPDVEKLKEPRVRILGAKRIENIEIEASEKKAFCLLCEIRLD